MATSLRAIELENVRVNNLKSLDLVIPHGQWISICGLSGSGKTSLALDTIYAEGQRRYIESLSPATRQFLQKLDKPDADRIEGVPPAIAIKAVRGKSGPRSTVGTATEVLAHLRVLFSKFSDVVCTKCGTKISRDDPQSVSERLLSLGSDTKFQVGFEVDLSMEPVAQLQRLRRQGFARVIIGSRTFDLAEAETAEFSQTSGLVVVDRLKANSPLQRVRESLETAFEFGKENCSVAVEAKPGCELDGVSLFELDGKPWGRRRFSSGLECANCGKRYVLPSPKLFSYASPLGACQACDGIGTIKGKICDQCDGSRLNELASAFQIGSKTIAELSRIPVEDLLGWLDDESEKSFVSGVAASVLLRIRQRLQYMCQVGLGYLSLDRSLNSLSTGEGQRVALTSVLGSTLVNILYVLDEPSRGLHAHDIGRLAKAVGRLMERKNTLVVVDHKETMIRAAERVIEIGPGAGESGGEIVFDGTPEAMSEPDVSLTGEYLSGRLYLGASERRIPRGKIKLVGANGHNLKNVDVEFPLGCLCVVTGVSGAGKSSLVQGTLCGALQTRLGQNADAPPLPYQDVFGESSIKEVVLVDQSPVGRSPRSNPVTYVKAFDEIRQAFADTTEAQARGFKAGHFSFNVPGGRCEKCDGDGCLTVDMQFLPDVVMRCDECKGTRFRESVLAVKYRNKNISEVLNLTVREAFGFFRGKPKVQAKLKALIDVGLDYIRLGQPSNQLSTGEAQRLKLALYLNANRKGRSLFLLDEPTAGLHMRDVVKLLDCLGSLVDVGHSMIIVEHNLQLIKHADWVIDLGPGASHAGGQVVACGTPEEIAANEDSLTGQWLKPLLD